MLILVLKVEFTYSDSTGTIESMNYDSGSGEALTDHMYSVCIKEEHNSFNHMIQQ